MLTQVSGTSVSLLKPDREYMFFTSPGHDTIPSQCPSVRLKNTVWTQYDIYPLFHLVISQRQGMLRMNSVRHMFLLKPQSDGVKMPNVLNLYLPGKWLLI